jgi:hypothetical protein
MLILLLALERKWNSTTDVPNFSPAGTPAHGRTPHSSSALATSSAYLGAAAVHPSTASVSSGASGASDLSATTATPASAAARQRGTSAAPSQPTHGATSGPRVDDTQYWTPARYPPAGSTASVVELLFVGRIELERE